MEFKIFVIYAVVVMFGALVIKDIMVYNRLVKNKKLMLEAIKKSSEEVK